MGIKRYELNEAQWAKIAPLLPGKANDPGRTRQMGQGSTASDISDLD
jgi:transposase